MKYKLREEKNIIGLDEYLRSRGIEDVERYMAAHLSDINDPFLLDEMEDAVQELIDHADKHVHLIVDSDTDGNTSSAIIYRYLKENFPNMKLSYTIHTEGKAHGILLNELQGEFFDLLIVPDAGSNDYDAQYELLDKKKKIIILDHHEFERRKKEKGLHLVNSQQESYPNKALSGAGMAFQFCMALHSKGYSNPLVLADICAVGLIADVMDMRSYENNAIVQYGLKNITNPFIRRLLVERNIDPHERDIVITDISFYVGPMINAVIRIGSFEDRAGLFQAFISDDEDFVANKAREARLFHGRQKTPQGKVEKKINDWIAQHPESEVDKALLINIEFDDYKESNLKGLVASKMSRSIGKPIILTSFNNQKDRQVGSIRAFEADGFDSFKEVIENTGLVEYVEGHGMAAGVGYKTANRGKLQEALNEALSDIDFSAHTYIVDAILDSETAHSRELWEMAEPQNSKYTGSRIEEYLIAFETTEYDWQVMGKNNNTIKFTTPFGEVIQFFALETIEKAKPKQTLKVVGKLSLNHYNGMTTRQIIAKDISFEKKKLYLSFL